MSPIQKKKTTTSNLSKLELKEVSFRWPNGERGLQNCSFSIPRTGLWMLVGSNGSGKSTLLRIISGLLKPQHGHLRCDLKPALMFQNPDHQLLLPSCGSDLMLNLPIELTNCQRQERIREALDQVGLTDMQARPIHTLSGGQKQRLALAGALASEASLLLLDEPTALLDPLSQQIVLETVQKLCRRAHKPLTAIWITHRLEELGYADGAIQMEQGQLKQWKSGHCLKEQLKPLAGRRG